MEQTQPNWTEIFPNSTRPHYGECVDCYAHRILSHGFMDQGLAGTVIDHIKQEKGNYDHKNPEHIKLFFSKLRPFYFEWAKQIKHPKKLEKNVGLDELLKLGWKEFVKD